MPSGKEFEDYARECVRLAAVADNEDLRQQLFHMAREWMSAAMQADEVPRAKSGTEQPRMHP